MKVFIYFLFNNATNNVLYVGATRSPITRERAHKNRLKAHPDVDSITLEVIEELVLFGDNAKKAEQYWYYQMKAWGFELSQSTKFFYKTARKHGDYTNTEKGFLADEFGKTTQTIEIWIRNKSDMLTTDRAKKALKKARKLQN